MKTSSGVPEEKALLIDSPAKRDKEVSSTPSNVYLLVSFNLSCCGNITDYSQK